MVLNKGYGLLKGIKPVIPSFFSKYEGQIFTGSLPVAFNEKKKTGYNLKACRNIDLQKPKYYSLNVSLVSKIKEVDY